MAPVDKFLQWLITLSVWGVVKDFLLLGMGLYLIFGLVMIRQVGLMRQTVQTGTDWLPQLLVWLHLVVAGVVLVWAVVVL